MATSMAEPVAAPAGSKMLCGMVSLPSPMYGERSAASSVPSIMLSPAPCVSNVGASKLRLLALLTPNAGALLQIDTGQAIATQRMWPQGRLAWSRPIMHGAIAQGGPAGTAHALDDAITLQARVRARERNAAPSALRKPRCGRAPNNAAPSSQMVA